MNREKRKAWYPAQQWEALLTPSARGCWCRKWAGPLLDGAKRAGMWVDGPVSQLGINLLVRTFYTKQGWRTCVSVASRPWESQP